MSRVGKSRPRLRASYPKYPQKIAGGRAEIAIIMLEIGSQKLHGVCLK